jgi:biopolymer transport protein ExbD
MHGGGGEAPASGGRKGRRGLKKTKIEIIPMIDTMFFLLVFFILSSVGVVKLQGININLPKAVDAPPVPTNQQNKELMVVIDKDRKQFVNGQPVGPRRDIRPLLRREIAKLYGGAPDMSQVSVVISADPAAPHGQVVTCIDQARALDITKFAIATKAEENTGGGGGAVTPTVQ